MDEIYDPFGDYSKDGNSDDGETREDLESRLYAEIYYAPEDRDFCSKTNYEDSKNKINSNYDKRLNSKGDCYGQPHEISNDPSTTEMQTNDVPTPSKKVVKERKLQDIIGDNASTPNARDELNSSDLASPETLGNSKSDDSHYHDQSDSKANNDVNIQTPSEKSPVIEKTNAKEFNSPKKISPDVTTESNTANKYKSPKLSVNQSLGRAKKKSPDCSKTTETATAEKEVEKPNTDTRYNVLDKQQKKKLKTNKIQESNITELSSDSDESVFEVPVPPKPAPPIVHLQDSDEDSVISIDDIDVKDRNKKQTNSKTSKTIGAEKSKSHEDPVEDIILNCTDIQKSTSSESQSRNIGSPEFHSERVSPSSTNVSSGSKTSNMPSSHMESNRNVDRNYEESSKGRKRHHESQANTLNDPKRFRGSYTNSSPNRLYTLQRRAIPLQIQTRKDWEEYFFQPMSNELRSFYTDSRGQENFSLYEVQNNMRRDPRLWTVSDDDLFPVSKRHRFWNIRCAHCQREGHHRNNCPEPQSLPCCRICGNPSHTGAQCTEKMCLTCGKKQSSFRQTCESCISLYCKMCKAVGHIADNCPDLWRRYHHTITNSDRIQPENLNVMKPKRLLYCCNCTKRGHDSSTCKQHRWSPHFPTPCYVTNYTDVPHHQPNNPPSRSTPKTPTSASTSSAVKDVASTSKRSNPEQQRSSSEQQRSNSKQQSAKKQSNQPQILYSCGPDLTCTQRNKNSQILYVQRVCKLDFLKKSDIKKFGQDNFTPTFLEDLLKLTTFQTIMSLHQGGELYLKIITQNDQVFLSRFINKILILWLSLEDIEKGYFKLIILPLKKDEMIVSLKNKLNELEQNEEDPRELWCKIKLWKNQVKFFRENNVSETDLSAIRSKLLQAQSTLNTILSYPNKSTLTDFIDQLNQSSEEKIPGKLYFKILFFFNDAFHCCTKEKTEFLITYVSDRINRHKKAHKSANTKDVENNMKKTKSSEIDEIQSNDTNQQEIPLKVPSTDDINPNLSTVPYEEDNRNDPSTSNSIDTENQFADSNQNIGNLTDAISEPLDNQTEINDESNNQLLTSSTFLKDDNDAINTENISTQIDKWQSDDAYLNQQCNRREKTKKKKTKKPKKLKTSKNVKAQQRTERLFDQAMKTIKRALRFRNPILKFEAENVKNKLDNHRIHLKDIKTLDRYISVCAKEFSKR